MILLAVGVGTFMSALDSSVVGVVLPVIRRTFNTDVATVEWVVTIYLLVVSGLLLVFGRLGDISGHKTLFIVGFAVFGASSAACGLAPTEVALIAARGLQALGAAMLFANSPAILTKSFPAEQRGRALGLQATMTYLGLTVGPPLGGWLTGMFSWRAVFVINIPIAAVGIALSWALIPRDLPSSERERFDVAGALTFIVGLVALMLALNQGHRWGWTSPAILGTGAAAVVLLAAFLLIEARVTSPMLDLSLFKDAVFSSATASALLNYVAIYGIIFLMPFYLISGRQLDPARAGLVLTVQAIVMAVVAPLSGAYSDRFGSRVPAALGMTILAGGLLLLSALGASTPLPYVAAALGITGLGTGIFISPNNSALMGAAPRARQGIAAGILAEARTVGMVLGVGLAGAIFTTMHGSGRGGPSPSLFAAIDTSFLAAAVVAGLAALLSATRGSSPPNGAPTETSPT